MDLLRGVQLVNKAGKYVLANHVLKEKKVILFYFVARTADPAMEFIPYLKEAYEASRVKDAGAGVEVILVSNVRLNGRVVVCILTITRTAARRSR